MTNINLYKKYFLAILLFFSANSDFAQSKIMLWDGTDNFEIGADLKKFGNEIKPIPGGVDSFCDKNKVYYNYQFITNGYEFGGLKFKYVALTFDESNKLIGIEMTQINKLDSTTSYQVVQDNAVLINKYLQNVLKKKGHIIEDYKYQNSIYKKLQWKKKNRKITLFVQLHKQNNIETIGISYGLWTVKCKNYN